ncbi:hypothetical protein PAL15_002400 [Salmonella enterica]|nr:hypothetical protein [Salmonella enterica]
MSDIKVMASIEDLSGTDSFETLTSGLHLFNLDDGSCDELAFDLLQCQEGVISGMKLMGRLLEERGLNHFGCDEYGDARSLKDLGQYLGGTATLLSGLSNALVELSAISARNK